MATPEEDYNAQLPHFTTIVPENYEKQVATAEEYHGDGVILFRTAQKYRAELIDEGMSDGIIDDLPGRANAFSMAASIVDTAVAQSDSDEQKWLRTKAEAFTFRRKLFRYGKFAFDSLDDLMAALNDIIEGTGDLDLAHDFLDIKNLYSTHIDKFTPIKKFSPELLETGMTYHAELLDLYAKVNRPEDEKNELVTIEKQAFTYFKQACNEIRRWAKLAFADQPEILKEFNVDFYRKK